SIVISEEQALSPADDAWNDIPIIVDDRGKTLMKAQLGKSFLHGTRPRSKVERRVKAIRDDADENIDQGTDDSESGDDTPPARHVKSKGKRKQAQSDDENDSEPRRGKKSRATPSLGQGPSQAPESQAAAAQQAMAQIKAQVDLLRGMGFSFDKM
ncbi:hypothetical protein H0H92_016149, partial [Tricholoma furcatifolium]